MFAPVISRISLVLACLLAAATVALGDQDWPQLKYDSRRSGNLPQRSVSTPLGLLAAAPLTDAVFTSPVLAGGRVYALDGSGVVHALDARTLQRLWRFETAGGKANCNNVASPAIADGYLHVGTMAGHYYVLDAANGDVVRTIDCGEPIFSAPVVGNGRVYFATLGSRVHALKPDGTLCWTWDMVREKIGFAGDRWSPADWFRARGQSGWPGNRRDHFCCTRSPALAGKTLVVPCGGTVIWLEDEGDRAVCRSTYYSTRESPVTLGLSLGEEGEVYRQWHRRDNNGSVEILRRVDDKLDVQSVVGTTTSYAGPESLSFCSVSLRGGDVYRCRPEETFGFCKHAPDGTTTALGGSPSVASAILLGDSAVFGGLDGRLHVVPLSGKGKPWHYQTAFGKAITAPVAVCDGRVYFGCDDGYLYALGPDGSTPPPAKDLGLAQIRSPLSSRRTGAQYDWFTSFGNLSNTNANDQQLRPPLKLKWIRRFEGTCKHFSVCGDGRVYTHTAEGQIFAVEQETGRLLWRRYYPGVHVSFTSPLFHQGRLFVPQAGLEKSRLRCFDAATGELLWEAPFSGTPSWNRQLPPIPYENLVVYPFSSAKVPAKQWLFEHQSTFGFPKDHKPLVRAYDVGSGKEVWTRDFSEFGAGGDDAGMCLMDGTLYYSCYFGGKGPLGVTAAIQPATGRLLWTTTDYCVHAGCTVAGKNGRLYLGGYNPVEEKTNRVWCLDARDGSLIWKSEPLSRAIHVVTVGERFLFTHSQYYNGFLLDKDTGKILSDQLTKGYRCTRFTLSEPYLLGPNLDMFDLSDPQNVKLVSCGPPVDLLVCLGGLVSNGRIFHTTNGTGIQCSAVYGQEAETHLPPWQRAAD
ncbi:MAG: PQQ-binding-like beta-propeller repeat protein [Pirellulales bacterium]|nr:PQQ-binding-like beta-propeller repeat protein [Pirellulales bacterium]